MQIIYLHGFDSNSPGNHEKVLQLQFIDPDVRLISYSTRHPKHDMQHLLKEVDKMLQLNADGLLPGQFGGGDVGLTIDAGMSLDAVGGQAAADGVVGVVLAQQLAPAALDLGQRGVGGDA